MCWFITVGVGKKGCAAIEALDRDRGGFGVRRSVNPALAAIFPRDDARFEITHGWCSCDLVGRGEPDDEDRRRRQYQSKGWSEAKIARALADGKSARKRSRVQGPRNEAKNRLHDILVHHAKQFGSVRVIAHFYSGSHDEELFSSSASRKVAAGEFLLSDLREDVLVEIVGGAG